MSAFNLDCHWVGSLQTSTFWLKSRAFHETKQLFTFCRGVLAATKSTRRSIRYIRQVGSHGEITQSHDYKCPFSEPIAPFSGSIKEASGATCSSVGENRIRDGIFMWKFLSCGMNALCYIGSVLGDQSRQLGLGYHFIR